jgi:hypothetical protein
MSTLDELKKNWNQDPQVSGSARAYDSVTLENAVKARIKKHTGMSMKYFWASFTLQIIVYSLLSHVIIRYWQNTETVLYSLGGILVSLPFTIMLMKKFKALALIRIQPGTSLHDYVLKKHDLLLSFYKFKRWYEFVLIPLSTAIGVVIVFNLYVPGGVWQHLTGAAITFAITIISCAFAIVSENKKSFEQPLHELHEILNEFKREAY